MGSGGKVACNNCAEIFEVVNGVGMSSYVLTCNRCGIQKMFPLFENESENKQSFTCSCKGEYVEDAHVKCPKCRSADFEYLCFINWD